MPSAGLPRAAGCRSWCSAPATPQPKAVPLSLVTRLEEIDCKKIELSNGRHMVQYRGQLMPLVPMSDEVQIKREGAQPLLVFSDGNRSMGLVVDEIVDIVEDQLDIQVASDHSGVLGSAVVRGQATEIIDVGHFLPLAYADWFRGQGVRVADRERTLLLVDDSAFFRNMLSPVLEGRGLRGHRGRQRGGGACAACARAGASTRWSPTSTCRTWTASRSRRRCAASSGSARCR